MKKLAAFLGVAAALFLTSDRVVLSHCEIPCGIYGDTLRISMFYEDIATIEKSMMQIEALMKEETPNANQISRWVSNKEEHANKVQHIVTQYFMTQRIKADDEKYVPKLTTAHAVMVAAMKCKQSADVARAADLRQAILAFHAAYEGKK